MEVIQIVEIPNFFEIVFFVCFHDTGNANTDVSYKLHCHLPEKRREEEETKIAIHFSKNLDSDEEFVPSTFWRFHLLEQQGQSNRSNW